MGAELAQRSEWHHDASLDWHLLQYPLHAGMQRMIRDLNSIYRRTTPLFQIDFEHHGFEWIDIHDRDNSIFAWLRRAADARFVVCIVNLTPVVRYDYRVGVPQGGSYAEIFNSDAGLYGGSSTTNGGGVQTEPVSHRGRDFSLVLNLPPLAVVYFKSEKSPATQHKSPKNHFEQKEK
ncbi:MAG: hypothetical protein E4H01_15375 [Lysobacterales bacterium]|nr:MAG: hypothetical protein E4H01_15375 [Xanthomonadales bacterium]